MVEIFQFLQVTHITNYVCQSKPVWCALIRTLRDYWQLI